jgi:hypothetical protein
MRTPAERLDLAVDQVLDTDRPPADSDPELRPLLHVAASVHRALPTIPAGEPFAARLAARLAEPNPVWRLTGRAAELARRGMHDRGRLIAAGAVSSAAVGVTVTAVAVWLTSRRNAAGHRAAHR